MDLQVMLLKISEYRENRQGEFRTDLMGVNEITHSIVPQYFRTF
jgi:hypothetical protein